MAGPHQHLPPAYTRAAAEALFQTRMDAVIALTGPGNSHLVRAMAWYIVGALGTTDQVKAALVRHQAEQPEP